MQGFEKCYSKIPGGHGKVFEILSKKIESRNNNIDMPKVIAFDSFDGANHLETVEGKIDLISFKSIVVNCNLLTSFINYSASKSGNILTWTQLAAKEEASVLKLALQSHHTS